MAGRRTIQATLHFLAVAICTAATDLDNFAFIAASSNIQSFCAQSYDMQRFNTASASQCAEYCNAQPGCVHFKMCTGASNLCCKLSATCRTPTTANTDSDGYFKLDPDYPYRNYPSGNLLFGQTATAFDTHTIHYTSYATDGQHQIFKGAYVSFPHNFYQATSSTGWITIPLAHAWDSEVHVENLIVRVYNRCDENGARNEGLQIFTQNPSTNAWEACGGKAVAADISVCSASDPTKNYWQRGCNNQAIAIKIQGDGTSEKWAIPEVEAFGDIANTTTSTTSTTTTTTTSTTTTSTTSTTTTSTTSTVIIVTATTTTTSTITTTTSSQVSSSSLGPCKATVMDNEGGSHPDVTPFQVGGVWVFQILHKSWYKLTSTDADGKKLECRHTKTQLTTSNAAVEWDKAIKGGNYNVKDVVKCSTASTSTITTTTTTTTSTQISNNQKSSTTSTATTAATTSTISTTSGVPCTDTDYGAKDSDGDTCSGYDITWCKNFDDKDFNSTSMCCVCGGGCRGTCTTTSTTATISSGKETHATGHGEVQGTVTAAPAPQPSSTPPQARTSTSTTSKQISEKKERLQKAKTTSAKPTTSSASISGDPKDESGQQDGDNDHDDNDDDGSAATIPAVAEEVVLKVNSKGGSRVTEAVGMIEKDTMNRAEVNGPPARTTIQTDEGQVHIAVQKASKSAVEESGIEVKAGGASAELPGEVALNLGPGESAACTMVAAPDLAFLVNESSKDSKPVVLGSTPVQIELKAVTADGNSRLLKVEELEEPIQITLNASGTKPPETGTQMELVCMAWDEDAKSWSDKGLTTQGSPSADGALVCESTHLTIFAAVWREALMAVLCSNLNVFTEKAMMKLAGKKGEKAWYEHKVGLVYFSLCLFALCSVPLAYRADCKSKYPPNLKRLFVNAKPPEEAEEEKGEEQKWSKVATEYATGFVKDNATAFGKSILFKVISKSIGICADDLAMLDALGDEATGQADDMAAELEDQQEEIAENLQFVMHHGILLRMARVTKFTHPVAANFRASVALPRTVRTLMFACKLWCAMLVAALFFQTSGEAVSVEDPEECAKTATIPLVRAIVVGCIAAGIAELVGYIEKLYPTTLKYIEGWSEKKVARQLLIWRVRYCVFIVVGLCYLLFCMLFVALFLASVTDIDKDTFVVSTLSQLAQQWFIVPLAVTLLISFVFVFVRDGNRLHRMIQNKFNLNKDDDQEKQTGSDADGTWEVQKDPVTGEVFYKNTATGNVRTSCPEVGVSPMAPGQPKKAFQEDEGLRITEISTTSSDPRGSSQALSTKQDDRSVSQKPPSKPLKLTQVLPTPDCEPQVLPAPECEPQVMPPPECEPTPELLRLKSASQAHGLFGTMKKMQRTLTKKMTGRKL